MQSFSNIRQHNFNDYVYSDIEKRDTPRMKLHI